MQVLTTITCDLTAHERGIMPQICAVQYDQQTRDVRVLLLQDGNAWDVPRGTVGMVNVQKPDGTIAFYDADADGTAAVQMLGGNLLQVRLAAQALTAAGTAYVSVSLYNADAEKLTTFKARLDIERSVVPEDAVTSTDYFSILSQEIAEVLAAAARTTGVIGIKGTYDSLAALEEAVERPEQGDIYQVGTEPPYTLYMWDETEPPGQWLDMGGLYGPKGDKGDTGNGIASMVLNADYTLTITYTDGTAYTTPSIRGAQGERGETGATGEAGNGIASATLNTDYTLTLTFTDGTTYTTPPIRGAQGETGATGQTGPTGVGITGIAKTGSSGLVDVYTITLSDGQTASFMVTNGAQGATGATGNGIANVQTNADYTLTITTTDGTTYTTPSLRGATGATGATGNGIASVVLGADYGLVITMTDGTIYTTPSIRGPQGAPGATGATGNGIANVQTNADYTLTITMSDGTTYTTPSMRGAQGVTFTPHTDTATKTIYFTNDGGLPNPEPIQLEGSIDEILERVARALEMIAATNQTNLDTLYTAILDGTNTTKTFRYWWPLSETEDAANTRYNRLIRWFTMLGNSAADKTYTLRWPTVAAAPNSDGTQTQLDDLAGKGTAQLCTETTQPVADWADEDQFTWYVRFNGLSLADGTMNVLAVEGVDGAFDVTGELAPVYTASLAKWRRQWTEGDYVFRSFKSARSGGFSPYAEDVAPDGTHRPMTWHPTFGGGLNANSGLTSGAGKKPYNRHSATDGLTAARITSAYEGLWNDCDARFLLEAWQLRHANLGNSGICDGCVNYNHQYRAALAETGVRRVLVTPAQGATLIVGSNVSIGETGDTETTNRQTERTYSMADNARITSIEAVTINGVDYAAVYVDVTQDFDTTLTTLISTAPWDAGATEALPGHKDGTLAGLTSGAAPIRVQGIEVLDGAYAAGLDPLYQVTDNAEAGLDYAIYTCTDSENLAGSVTDDYAYSGLSETGLTSGWHYISEENSAPTDVLWPSALGGSGTTRYKAALGGSGSAGVRSPLRYGGLTTVATGGLATENPRTPNYRYWDDRPRLGGAGKKRGTWQG